MQFDTYTAAGAHIACWMANNPVADPAALGSVLAGYDVHEPIVTWRQIRALEPWAGCLRTVFEAASEAERAQRTDALLIAACALSGGSLPTCFVAASSPLGQSMTNAAATLDAFNSGTLTPNCIPRPG